MEGIDINAIVGIGSPWALLAIGILALIRGDLLPRSTHMSALDQRDRMIRDITDERDYYRARNEQLTGTAETYADFLANRQAGAMLQRPNLQRERGSP